MTNKKKRNKKKIKRTKMQHNNKDRKYDINIKLMNECRRKEKVKYNCE